MGWRLGSGGGGVSGGGEGRGNAISGPFGSVAFHAKTRVSFCFI